MNSSHLDSEIGQGDSSNWKEEVRGFPSLFNQKLNQASFVLKPSIAMDLARFSKSSSSELESSVRKQLLGSLLSGSFLDLFFPKNDPGWRGWVKNLDIQGKTHNTRLALTIVDPVPLQLSRGDLLSSRGLGFTPKRPTPKLNMGDKGR